MRIAALLLFSAAVGALAGGLYGRFDVLMRRSAGRRFNFSLDRFKPKTRPGVFLYEICLAPVVLGLAAMPFVMTMMAPTLFRKWFPIWGANIVVIGYLLALSFLWLGYRTLSEKWGSPVVGRTAFRGEPMAR